MRNKKKKHLYRGLHKNKCLKKKIFCFVFALTFPGVACQPHSSMTVSAAFVADVDRWLRRVCRVGRLLLPLLPLYSFMHIYILLSSFHSCLYDCSPVPTIICGCLPCRSVDSRHFHVAFACISVAEIRTAYCTRSSDELTIQHVFWDAPVSHSMDMAKPSQTPLA